tara:strand:+ start:134 stop:805 length:672 start_codon:yes stop_codon:yes gene_type:complete
MDYLKHYNKLVQRSQARIDSELYVESHHIIPRCLGGSDSPSNLVNLTPEEHYVAHQLLVKLHPTNSKLYHAANMMVANRTTNKSYGWIRRGISESMKGSGNPNYKGKARNEYIKKYGIPLSTKYELSESGREILSKKLIGENNPCYAIEPWNHPRATETTIAMWSKADQYYEWWINSGLTNGQNAMARHFKEVMKMTHTNLIKRFKSGWIPTQDTQWILFNNT